jgi:hypothetical protein
MVIAMEDLAPHRRRNCRGQRFRHRGVEASDQVSVAVCEIGDLRCYRDGLPAAVLGRALA